MKLKDLIPPVLLRLGRRAHSKTPAYATYEDALARCGPGYDTDELARVVVEKTIRYRDSLRSGQVVITDLRTASVPTAIGLSVSGSSLNCLDFGGAAGAHFFLAQKLFGGSVEFHWNVVETKSMVSAATGMTADGLRFFPSIDEAVSAFKAAGKQIDLVFTSGALQYLPKPEETLAQLLGLGARRIFITRVGLSDQRLAQRVSIQRVRLGANGPGPLPVGFKDRDLTFPVTFCSKDELERMVKSRYVIDLTFLEERDAYSIGSRSIDLFGFFGRREDEPTPRLRADPAHR